MTWRALCTRPCIEPNSTRVYVPDERFDWLVEQNKPKSVVQPYLEVVDIAGRGLHSSTFRPDVSAFCGIGDACRDC
jgi:hypothetical protein